MAATVVCAVLLFVSPGAFAGGINPFHCPVHHHTAHHYHTAVHHHTGGTAMKGTTAAALRGQSPGVGSPRTMRTADAATARMNATQPGLGRH